MSLTKIEWVEHSVNPIRVKGGKAWPHGYHCTKVSAGCAHCYAESMNMRFGTGLPFDNRKVEFYLDLSVFDDLPKKKPTTVFVQSMGDIFHEQIPFWVIDLIFPHILASHGDNRFLFLTKRPERMKEYFDIYHSVFITVRNIWLGVTAENQEQADKRIPILLQIPAAKRFVSIEPMLGGVDIIPYLGGQTHRCKCGWHETELDLLPRGDKWYCVDCESYCENYPGIDWAIIGAESGPKRRPCEIELVRDLAGQCVMTKTPLFIKQLHINGRLSKNPDEWPEDLRIQKFPHD